jgi:hypothetical protein
VCPLFLAPYRLDRIRPLEGVTVLRLPSEGRRGVAALNARGLGLEMEDQVGLAVVVHVPHMAFAVYLCPVGAEADGQRIDGGGIEGIGGQDGDLDGAVALVNRPF